MNNIHKLRNIIKQNTSLEYTVYILLFLKYIEPHTFNNIQNLDKRAILNQLKSFLIKMENKHKLKDISLIFSIIKDNEINANTLKNIFNIINNIEQKNTHKILISFFNPINDILHNNHILYELLHIFIDKSNESVIFNPFLTLPFIHYKNNKTIIANVYNISYLFINTIYLYIMQIQNFQINLCKDISQCNNKNINADISIFDLRQIGRFSKKYISKTAESILKQSIDNTKSNGKIVFIATYNILKRIPLFQTLLKQGAIDTICYTYSKLNTMENIIVYLNKDSIHNNILLISHQLSIEYNLLKDVLTKRKTLNNEKGGIISKVLDMYTLQNNQYDINIRLYIKRDYTGSNYNTDYKKLWDEKLKELKELNGIIDKFEK